MRLNAGSIKFFIPFIPWCLLVCLFSLRPAWAGDVSLQWDPNTEADLAGYKVYYGKASRTYSPPVTVGLKTTYTVTNLPAGTYYFAVTAFSTDGLESAFSNEVSTTISGPPTTNTPCDINSDGQSDAGDVQFLIGILIGPDAADSRYDLNKDGKVNILDLQILTNVVLGVRSCP